MVTQNVTVTTRFVESLNIFFKTINFKVTKLLKTGLSIRESNEFDEQYNIMIYLLPGEDNRRCR